MVTRLIARGQNGLHLLTRRERDVLALMAEGYTNVGIARRLWLSDRTVETHTANIIAKLGLTDSDEEHRRVAAVLTYLGHRRAASGTASSRIPLHPRHEDGRSSNPPR